MNLHVIVHPVYQPHVVPNMYDLLSSMEHKRKFDNVPEFCFLCHIMQQQSDVNDVSK